MLRLRTIGLARPAWRVHKDPTVLPNLPADGEKPPNRFDDPERTYRVRYLATNKRGAFLEVLARFRVDPETQKRLGAVKNIDEANEPELSPGSVPRRFLSSLNEATVSAKNPATEFADITSPQNCATLNKSELVRQALKKSGLEELNLETARLGGPVGRPVTQAVSRVVFDETEAGGIHYISRVDPTEPCWAVFDWVEMVFAVQKKIALDDEALKAAVVTLGLKLS